MHTIQFAAICFGILITGCKPGKVITDWKTEPMPGSTRQKLLVVAIVGTPTDSIRVSLENSTSEFLSGLGYNAVSAVKEFGIGGLSEPGQEATYLKLCNDGIDAVLTIALVDKSIPGSQSVKMGENMSLFYFNRVWNYRTIQADLTKAGTIPHELFWEGILFDLRTLQPVCVVHTRTFKPVAQFDIQRDLVFDLLARMRKEKALTMQSGSRLRPF